LFLGKFALELEAVLFDVALSRLGGAFDGLSAQAGVALVLGFVDVVGLAEAEGRGARGG